MHKDVPAVIAVPVCSRVFVVAHIRTDGKKLPIARDAPAQRSFVYSCYALTGAAGAAVRKKFHEEVTPPWKHVLQVNTKKSLCGGFVRPDSRVIRVLFTTQAVI